MMKMESKHLQMCVSKQTPKCIHLINCQLFFFFFASNPSLLGSGGLFFIKIHILEPSLCRLWKEWKSLLKIITSLTRLSVQHVQHTGEFPSLLEEI